MNRPALKTNLKTFEKSSAVLKTRSGRRRMRGEEQGTGSVLTLASSPSIGQDAGTSSRRHSQGRKFVNPFTFE
jgi:hypothetical protein